MQSRLKVKTTSPSPWSARPASSLLVSSPPVIHPPVIPRRALFARRRTYAPASSSHGLSFRGGATSIEPGAGCPHVSPLLGGWPSRSLVVHHHDRGCPTRLPLTEPALSGADEWAAMAMVSGDFSYGKHDFGRVNLPRPGRAPGRRLHRIPRQRTTGGASLFVVVSATRARGWASPPSPNTTGTRYKDISATSSKWKTKRVSSSRSFRHYGATNLVEGCSPVSVFGKRFGL
jgi:hypothetical protein